jgi:hypothetical protein
MQSESLCSHNLTRQHKTYHGKAGLFYQAGYPITHSMQRQHDVAACDMLTWHHLIPAGAASIFSTQTRCRMYTRCMCSVRYPTCWAHLHTTSHLQVLPVVRSCQRFTLTQTPACWLLRTLHAHRQQRAPRGPTKEQGQLSSWLSGVHAALGMVMMCG